MTTKLPNKLEFTGTHTATTYHFRGAYAAWACVTINDATGELTITSDWGNWSHRWNIAALGCPTLTDFIRTTGYDYLIDKLHLDARSGGHREAGKDFDAIATVIELRIWMSERHTMATILTNRDLLGLWESLWVHAEHFQHDARGFIENLDEDVFEYITDAPYEHLVYRESSSSKALREHILPALREALETRRAPAPPPAP